MIAYLASSHTIGANIVRTDLGLSINRTCTSRTLVRSPTNLLGFIASDENDLRGVNLSGIVVLDHVDPELIGRAFSRLTERVAP